MLCLTVTLHVKDGMTERFLEAMAANQQGALEDEPDCLTFVVGRDVEEANVFNLCEVYRDAAALEAHRGSTHFKEWRQAAADVLEPSLTVARLSELVLNVEGSMPARGQV